MKVVYGKEAYLIDALKKKLKASYDVFETSVLDDEAKMFLSTESFFSTANKLIIYYPEDLKAVKKLDKTWINETNVVLFFYGDLSQLSLDNVEVVCYDKLSHEQLRRLILEKVPNLEYSLLEEFITLSEYYTNDNIDLYCVLSEVDKLKCFDNVTREILQGSVGVLDVAGDAFKEGDYIIKGLKSKAISNAEQCHEGDELAFIGALQRFFRVGWKLNHYNSKYVGKGTIINPVKAAESLEILDDAWRKITVGSLPPKIALMKAIFSLISKFERG